MIAEVASAEGLRALIEGLSEEVDLAGKEKEERERSVEWVKAFLELDEEEHAESDDDGDANDDANIPIAEQPRNRNRNQNHNKNKTRKNRCLARRMSCFESAEAEGRQFARAVLERGGKRKGWGVKENENVGGH